MPLVRRSMDRRARGSPAAQGCRLAVSRGGAVASDTAAAVCRDGSKTRAWRGAGVLCDWQSPRATYGRSSRKHRRRVRSAAVRRDRSEEHTSELQSQSNLVCRLLLEKKKKNKLN